MTIERLLRSALQLLSPRRGSGTTRPPSEHAPSPARRGGIATYDATRWGAPSFSYSPDPDGEADPGEIVWGWVPYEEDATQGKDRPLLIVGTRGPDLVGLQLTSKDHSRDPAREAARGRVWVDIGSGAWDSRGRDSEVRVDRVLIVDRGAVRREGATLDRGHFDAVTGAVRRHHGW